MYILKKNIDIVIYCLLLVGLVIYAVFPSHLFSNEVPSMVLNASVIDESIENKTDEIVKGDFTIYSSENHVFK